MTERRRVLPRLHADPVNDWRGRTTAEWNRQAEEAVGLLEATFADRLAGWRARAAAALVARQERFALLTEGHKAGQTVCLMLPAAP